MHIESLCLAYCSNVKGRCQCGPFSQLFARQAQGEQQRLEQEANQVQQLNVHIRHLVSVSQAVAKITQSQLVAGQVQADIQFPTEQKSLQQEAEQAQQLVGHLLSLAS